MQMLAQPIVSERWWMSFVCSRSGVFVLPAPELTMKIIGQDAKRLSAELDQLFHHAWTAWLTKTFLVPIYCASGFSPSIVQALTIGAPIPCKPWGVTVKPVLYNTAANLVEFREAFQNYHSANAYECQRTLYLAGLESAAKCTGNDFASLTTRWGCPV